ncbi:MAG: glutathione peroxidase [Clostridia bacterium]|nr:glutathione peroxidase [Clostridia bacterium]
MSSFYDFSVLNAKNEQVSLDMFKGKVVMVVNTATGCGFTPQYEPIEKMYEDFKDKGFDVLDIPCNQFANQAPGTDEEIHQFCTLKYKTQFPQMKKAFVNGEEELPLYTFLKKEQPFKGKGTMKMLGLLSKAKGNDIRWNFTKFIIDKEGNVVARFEPTVKMEEVRKFVEELLNK